MNIFSMGNMESNNKKKEISTKKILQLKIPSTKNSEKRKDLSPKKNHQQIKTYQLKLKICQPILFVDIFFFLLILSIF